jgi:natural product precursor
VKKKTIKKLTLNKESILRLDPSELREVVGGGSRICTGTETCTDSCGTCGSGGGATCLC